MINKPIASARYRTIPTHPFGRNNALTVRDIANAAQCNLIGARSFELVSAPMRSIAPLLFALALVTACNGPDTNDNVGAACESPNECFPEVEDRDALVGEIVCLGDVPGGYCTHLCETDDDCCAVEGECLTDFPQVCAPFQSTGMKMCFLSCEGIADDEHFCQEEAHPSFGCRSTGGGSENRKVCVP